MSRHSTRRPGRGARAAVVTAVVGLAALTAALTTAVAAQAAPAGPSTVPGTPCTVTAKACVDVAGKRAWLIANGAVTRGPVRIMPGDPSDPTPVGTSGVQWKDAHHVSDMPNHAPMPNSVFFADGGVAFHEGSLTSPSAGCVHLSKADAQTWFDTLQVGDQVQVH